MRKITAITVALLLLPLFAGGGIFAEQDTVTAKSVDEHGQITAQNWVDVAYPYAVENEEGNGKTIDIRQIPHRLLLAYEEIQCAATALDICKEESVGDYCDQAEGFLHRADEEIKDFQLMKKEVKK